MSRKNRKDEILSVLDSRIAHGTAAVKSARDTIADPNATDAARRTSKGALSVINPRLADDKNLAAGLRSGELDADDDNFSTWTR